MPEEEKPEAVEEDTSYYDEVRADVETAVYTFSALQELDIQLFGKPMQKKIKDAKDDCVFIMCKGLELIKECYEESEDDE